MSTKTVICPDCETEVKPGDQACPECGLGLFEIAQRPRKAKSKEPPKIVTMYGMRYGGDIITVRLKENEKTYTILVLAMIVTFFAAGVVFGYKFIMPAGINWLLDVASGQMNPVMSASSYVNFSGWFMLGLGVSFLTPVFIWMLVVLNVVQPEQLKNQWRWALIIILLIASIITPDWNPVTMVLVALPMLVLYIISIGLAFATARRRRAKLAEITGEVEV